MKPLHTPHTTRVLNAPRKWDEQRDGECDGLPVVDGDGFLCSYWQPSWKERLLILCGRNVRLTVKAETTPMHLATQPPVMLDTEKL